MREMTERALDTASAKGASYADARTVRRLEESISIKTGRVEGVASGESEGFGVRVLVDGAWGFSSSALLEPEEAERVTREALEISRASAIAQREPVQLDDTEPIKDTYRTPYEEDPFSVSLDEKLRILLDADAAMARVDGVAIREIGRAHV